MMSFSTLKLLDDLCWSLEMCFVPVSPQWCDQMTHLPKYDPQFDEQHDNLPLSLDIPVDFNALYYSFIADTATQN